MPKRTRDPMMNHYVYMRRRRKELTQLKFKLQRLFSFLHYKDFNSVQGHLDEADRILKKYDAIN